MYSMLRDNLMDRLFDKEPLIRSHAVAALSKLVGTEDPDEVEEGEKSILEILLDVVSSDTAACVPKFTHLTTRSVLPRRIEKFAAPPC